MEPQTGARVVINERAGSIVISGDVEIGAVAVTHKNRRRWKPAASARQAVHAVDTAEPASPKLKALVESLNAIHVRPRKTSSRSSKAWTATANSTPR